MESQIAIIPSSSTLSSLNHVEQTTCKFCLESSLPLVSLCQCAGTIRYVHQSCLLTWLKTMYTAERTITKPKCSICKSDLSLNTQFKGKCFDFRGFMKNLTYHIVFQFAITLLVVILAINNIVQNGDQVSLKTAFTYVVVPIYICLVAINWFRKNPIWKNSYVLLINVVMFPHEIIE